MSDPLVSRANAVQAAVQHQLSAPAALIVPPQVRRLIVLMADLLVLLASRVDLLSPPTTTPKAPP